MTASRTHQTSGGREQHATSRRWLGLLALALPTFVIGMDLTALHMAMPSIATDLQPGPVAQLWIVDSYGFAVAGLLLIMGNVGDRIGRRRLLMLGAAGFAVASVLAAFAPSAGLLILGRALLGIAGATLMPSTLSLIRNLFPDNDQRRRAIAVWMAALLTGTAMGPLIGGLVVEAAWWGAVFLLAVPVMALLLVIGPFVLPSGTARSAGPLDWGSVALALVTILPAVYAIKDAAAHGPNPGTAVLIPLSVVAAVMFVRRQRSLSHPLLDVSLFSDAQFSVATLTHLGALGAVGGMQYLFALYLQLALGMSPIVAGLWTLPGATLGLIGALAAPALAQRIPPRALFGSSLALGALAVAVMAAATTRDPLAAVTGYAVVSLAVGLVTTLTTDHILAAAPPERAGMASGVTETAAELGIALGIALLGSTATAVLTRSTDEPLTAMASQATRATFVDGMSLSAMVAGVVLASLAAAWIRVAGRANLATQRPPQPPAQQPPQAREQQPQQKGGEGAI